MLQITGAPKTVVSVSDQTNLLSSDAGGYICVQGETLRGEPGKAVFVSSSGQFRRDFGGFHPTSPFPLYCLRLLDAGAKLWVARAAHYTDLSDRGSAAGTKATGNLVAGGTTSASFAAKFVGTGYNGATVQVLAPSSFRDGVVDLIISLPGSDEPQTQRDVKASQTPEEIVALNKKLKHVSLVSGTLVPGTATLAGGVEDVTAITAADYNGTSTGQTGWYAFGSVTDSYRIANLHKPIPAIDAGLAAYVTGRGDMRFHLGLPLEANALGMEDYRMGTGAYSHTPINTWLGNFIGGWTVATNGVDYETPVLIPGVVEALANIAAKDAGLGPWYSAAGFQRGRLRSYVDSVPYNLFSSDLSADADRLYARGVNYIAKDDVEGPVLWGNRSALLDQTKLLSRENVADLFIYLSRTFKPIFRRQQFEPNDVKMWRRIYRQALTVLGDLETREAIEPGEGAGWVWQGDQNAPNRASATYNTQSDLAAGRYRVRLLVKPIGATEYMGLELVAADANSFTILQGQNSTF